MDNSLSVNIITWNVATVQPPPPGKLATLFNMEADLIAIGLQEVKSQPADRVYASVYEDVWTSAIRGAMYKNDYVLVHSIRLVGILLSFFCKRSHLISIQNIETSYTRTGLKGYWGNKGAVSIRFNLMGSSICLVNSHLTPHDDNLQKRINDYYSIIDSQTFQSEKISSILDHDLVFWFGDLNFRLATNSFSSKEIINLLNSNDTEGLLLEDELNQVMFQNSAFTGFKESKISFKPTYKFIPESEQIYDEKRRPAWTDRIIHKIFVDSKKSYEEITCKNYQSHPDMNFSDHLPVSGLFHIKVKGGSVPQVSFDPISPWSSDSSAKIVYHLPANFEPTPYHWIAFFLEGFTSLNDYVTWQWVPGKHLTDRPGTYETEVSRGALRNPAKYVVAYMSEKSPYSILGISSTFEVTDLA